MVVDADWLVGNAIHLTDVASKGKSGRAVPLNKQLHANLVQMLLIAKERRGFALETAYVITTERSARTSAQAVVNMFKRWCHDLGLLGC